MVIRKIKNEYLRCIVLFFILLILQFLFSRLSIIALRFIKNPIENYTYFSGTKNHLFCFIIPLIICIILKKKCNINLGLEFKEHKKGILFILISIVFALVIQTIVLLFNNPYQEESLLSYFIFQFFFSGLGEEIIYRSLSLGLMIYFCGKANIKIGKLNIHLGLILSALLFSIAHISISFNPFELNYSYLQLGVAFIMGIVYGLCYIKTKSVWYCMIAHSVYNCTLMIPTLIVLALK